MTHDQLAKSLAASHTDHTRYDDLYQEAWVGILEAKEKGLDEKALYWYVKTHVYLYKTYKDRLVTLPPRSGNIGLAESQEIEYDIQDYIAKTEDHAEKYEMSDYIKYMMNKLQDLSIKDRIVLDHVYFQDKSFVQLGEETGTSYQLWQQRHNTAINNLRKLVDE